MIFFKQIIWSLINTIIIEIDPSELGTNDGMNIKS